MNPNFIKAYIGNNLGKNITIKVYGLRNKIDSFTGIIDDIYPKIFTIKTPNGIKSISYSEIISGEVKIISIF